MHEKIKFSNAAVTRSVSKGGDYDIITSLRMSGCIYGTTIEARESVTID